MIHRCYRKEILELLKMAAVVLLVSWATMLLLTI